MNISNLRIFGCVAVTYLSVMLGFVPIGYRLWNLEKQKLILVRDVYFDELSFHFKKNVSEFRENNIEQNVNDKGNGNKSSIENEVEIN